MQPNTMWQQPPPQSSSTNPFAAPSGQSVRNCSLHLFLAYIFFFSISFFALALALSLILFFFSYLKSSVKQRSSFNPFFSSFLFLLLVLIDKQVNNNLFTCAYTLFFRSIITNILVGRKRKENGQQRLSYSRLSCFHYSSCLVLRHMCFIM